MSGGTKGRASAGRTKVGVAAKLFKSYEYRNSLVGVPWSGKTWSQLAAFWPMISCTPCTTSILRNDKTNTKQLQNIHPKTNMDTQNDGLEKVTGPFKNGIFFGIYFWFLGCSIKDCLCTFLIHGPPTFDHLQEQLQRAVLQANLSIPCSLDLQTRQEGASFMRKAEMQKFWMVAQCKYGN